MGYVILLYSSRVMLDCNAPQWLCCIMTFIKGCVTLWCSWRVFSDFHVPQWLCHFAMFILVGSILHFLNGYDETNECFKVTFKTIVGTILYLLNGYVTLWSSYRLTYVELLHSSWSTYVKSTYANVHLGWLKCWNDISWCSSWLLYVELRCSSWLTYVALQHS